MIVFPRLFKPGMTLSVAGQVFTSVPRAWQGTVSLESLRVAFRVRRSMSSTPDTCDVAISNVAPERRTAMAALFAELGRAPLTLQIGYDNVLAQVFAGDVRTMRTSVLEDDTVTSITADDSGDAIEQTTINVSTLGLTAQNMIDVALAAMAGPPTFSPIVAHPSVAAALATATPAATLATYTMVSIGKATDLLDEAARILGARWWIRDFQLFMAVRGVPTDGLAIVLPPTHLLDEPSNDGGGVVHALTFADPNLTPGRQVLLADADGRVSPCRVEAVELSGDTHGDAPWSAALDLRRITPG